MENMQNNSFATCGDSLFFDTTEGIMIIPENIPKMRISDTKREFMELKKQKLLKRFTDPAEKERDSRCAICGDNNTKTFLFPTCRIVHYFACEGCIPEILRDGGSACSFPGCKNDTLLREEFENIIEQQNGGATAYTQAIDLLTLTIPGRWPNQVLIKQETVVTLKNIALSDILLFKLLEKTKVVVGENVSVFGNFKGEDCIRAGTDFEGLRLLRPASFQEIQISVCFMENIIRMANSSIKLGKVERLKLQGYMINILPKLILYEENVMKKLSLDADEKLHLLEILYIADNSIQVGKVKKLKLQGYMINILPKLILYEENVMKKLSLDADEKLHLLEILYVADNSIQVGKVKRLKLCNYSIRILPRLKIHGKGVVEELLLDVRGLNPVPGTIIEITNASVGTVKTLLLRNYPFNVLSKLVFHKEESEILSIDADKKEHVPNITSAGNNAIWLGKVKKLELCGYSINILPNLKLCSKGAVEELSLNAREMEHVSGIIHENSNNVCVKMFKELAIWNYFVHVLPKLVLHKEMEMFFMGAIEKEHVSGIVYAENNTIKLGKVKKMKLYMFAINILPKLVLHGENGVEKLILSASEIDHVSEIIRAENNSIKLGKVKTLELKSFAISILPKLKLHEENLPVENTHREKVMEEICLSLIIPKLEHAYKIILAEKHRISTRGVKNLVLSGYAINFLPEIHGASDL
ncbi:MAG: uncharacterized protein A8A55_2849, partial [Amphiamblys sp. WSBS2006]